MIVFYVGLTLMGVLFVLAALLDWGIIIQSDVITAAIGNTAARVIGGLAGVAMIVFGILGFAGVL